MVLPPLLYCQRESKQCLQLPSCKAYIAPTQSFRSLTFAVCPRSSRAPAPHFGLVCTICMLSLQNPGTMLIMYPRFLLLASTPAWAVTAGPHRQAGCTLHGRLGTGEDASASSKNYLHPHLVSTRLSQCHQIRRTHDLRRLAALSNTSSVR